MTPCCHNSWLFETKIKKMKMKKLWQSGLTWAEAQDQVNNEQPTTRSGGKYCDTAVMWLYLIRWYNVSSHCSWNCNQWTQLCVSTRDHDDNSASESSERLLLQCCVSCDIIKVLNRNDDEWLCKVITTVVLGTVIRTRWSLWVTETSTWFLIVGFYQ